MEESKIVEDPKQMVWEMMTSFSEKMWLARWLSGLEFILWSKVRKCSDDLTLREIADFNFYAGLAGGWWMWGKAQKCEVFVTLDEWLTLVTQQEGTNPQ
ncbi:MAG: hypothetical protein V7K89_21570 [Nostoc sp.]|uniref:hypothetical protein n=1 Tax=Nostoc sp. TaxID=1180 RepID=UPI002FFD12ED